MASRTELDREINSYRDLIKAANQAAREYRQQADRADDDAEKRRLRGEADKKDRDVAGWERQIGGLEAHKRGL